MSLFERNLTVSFGDCDPAGIVYYPNYFRWMDATFHAYLLAHAGGHPKVCKDLNTVGLGLMETRLTFLLPASDCDAITFCIDAIKWSGRSFDVTYSAHAGDRKILEGYERRGLFLKKNGKMRAGDVGPLRDLLGL